MKEKYLEVNDYENVIYKNLGDVVKIVFWRKGWVLDFYIRKEESLRVDEWSF